MKATLHFKFPEEQEEYNLMVLGPATHRCLKEIHEELFRAARKHGYRDAQIKEKLDQCNELKILNSDRLEPVGDALLEALERKFFEILSEHNVEI